MEKTQKMWLIGGGIAALGLVTYLVVSKSNTTSMSNTTTITPSGSCPSGQVPCANNRLKCYNPMANYTLDPCASLGTNTGINNTAANPIAEIVDGIIGLFKKKPVATTPVV